MKKKKHADQIIYYQLNRCAVCLDERAGFDSRACQHQSIHDLSHDEPGAGDQRPAGAGAAQAAAARGAVVAAAHGARETELHARARGALVRPRPLAVPAVAVAGEAPAAARGRRRS